MMGSDGRARMRIAALIGVIAVMGGCGGLRQPTPERQQLKAACVAGDMSACSEIGHAARRDMDMDAE